MEEGIVYQVISVQPVGMNTRATVSSALSCIPRVLYVALYYDGYLQEGLTKES